MISASEDDFKRVNKEVCHAIFNGKDKIKIDDFKEFRATVRRAMAHYEFYTYDVDEAETISVEDFSRSLLSVLPSNKRAFYLKRMDEYELKGRINFH